MLDHNLETVPRLYPAVRPQAEYGRSLELLRRAAVWARSQSRGASGASGATSRPLVKTGLMVGLGEGADELAAVLADCAAAGVDLVTVGQYLQPGAGCLPVSRYVPPAEFHRIERQGAALGLRRARRAVRALVVPRGRRRRSPRGRLSSSCPAVKRPGLGPRPARPPRSARRCP